MHRFFNRSFFNCSFEVELKDISLIFSELDGNSDNSEIYFHVFGVIESGGLYIDVPASFKLNLFAITDWYLFSGVNTFKTSGDIENNDLESIKFIFNISY